MRFGAVPVVDAEGAVLAHSLEFAGKKLRKGRVLAAVDVAAMQAAGMNPEDMAAAAGGGDGDPVAAGGGEKAAKGQVVDADFVVDDEKS